MNSGNSVEKGELDRFLVRSPLYLSMKKPHPLLGAVVYWQCQHDRRTVLKQEHV